MDSLSFQTWLTVSVPGAAKIMTPAMVAYISEIEQDILGKVGVSGWEHIGAANAEQVVALILHEIEEMISEDYDEAPVTPYEFLHDPDYIGYGGQVRLWPILEEAFYEIFEPGNGIHEAIFSGAIGWGKTHLASVCFAYMLYKLSCLKDPQGFYGMDHGSPIVLMNLSVTGDQAKAVFFAYVTNLIFGPHGQPGSPYFMEKFAKVNKAEAPMVFPKNIVLYAGNSSELSAIGQNIIGGFIDECNFMISTRTSKHERAGVKDGEDPNHALNLYRAISRRIKSRFMAAKTEFPGKLLLASSVTYPDDFLAQMIEKKRSDSSTLILEYSQWATHPVGDFGEDRFRVLVGDEVTDSRMLDDAEPDPVLSEESGATLIHVPEEFRSEFDLDLDGAIRDIAGVATITVLPFMPQRAKLHEATKVGVEDYGLAHPFTMMTTTLMEAGFDVIPDVLAKPKKFVDPVTGNERTQWVPRRSPEIPRVAHFDYSVSDDAAGFAFGYSPGTVDVRRKTSAGEEVIEATPIVVIEGMLQVVPPRGGEIQLSQMRSLIHMLENYGIRFENISFDQFQSKESGQILQSAGYNVNWQSVDRSIAPYVNLKYGLYGQRIFLYPHPVVIREFSRLQLDKKKRKVDHPEFDAQNPSGKGSKDVADCVCAVAQYYADAYTQTRMIQSPIRGHLRDDDKGTRDSIIADFNRRILGV